MNQISWNKYVELAERTESIPNNSFELGNGFNNFLTRLLHAQLGLQTEVQEYQEGTDLKNKIEELGDTYWYMAVIHNTLKPLALIELIQSNQTWDQEISLHQGVHHWIAEMADVLKRCLFYGEHLYEINKKGIIPSHRFMVAYWGVTRWLEDQSMLDGIPDATELFAMNIEKLSKRYPELAFKPSDALTRNVENELSHIPEAPTSNTHAILDILLSPEGLEVRNQSSNYEIHVGCDPRDVKRFIEEQVFGLPIEEVEARIGYSLAFYITSIYCTVDDKLFLKLTPPNNEPEEIGVYEQVFEVAPPVSNQLPNLAQPEFEEPSNIEVLDFSTFRRVMHENYPNFTDLLTFGGCIFSALDQYYSNQECHAVSKAYKAGYVELMAYRPSQSSQACRDIWAIIGVWGPMHVYGIPRTTVDLYKMINSPKELCLCPSMLKK